MQFIFGVIIPGALITSVSNSKPTVRLCGSIPELGSWSVDLAPQLNLSTKEFYEAKPLKNEPRFYRVDLNISQDIKQFEYKYVINNQLWEGKHRKNRVWLRDDCKNLVDQVYYTPIDYWTDTSTGTIDEIRHTGNFFGEITTHQIMHYGRVNDKLFVGSCPRTFDHIEKELKNKLNVTAVLNLQIKQDIEKNCKSILGNKYVPEPNNQFDLTSVEILKKAYEQVGILFLWIPTTDMSTIGRELMLPQSALTLRTLLSKGHRVYVHCNAGVGRAFGTVCAYHHFVLKVPLPQVHYDLAPIRSCGYFDRNSLEKAEIVYRQAYD